MIELFIFILVVGAITALVARGGASGSIVLTLVSIVVGCVLGTCAFVPFMLALIHIGVSNVLAYVIVWFGLVVAAIVGTYALGALTMPRDK